MQLVCPAFVFKQYVHICILYRCICSNRNRLSFYAEIQIIFGIVCGQLKNIYYIIILSPSILSLLEGIIDICLLAYACLLHIEE